MKYLEYLLILTWHILSKAIGYWWFFIIVQFRGYARSVVYNYTLEHNIYLKRLRERLIIDSGSYYRIISNHTSQVGILFKKSVSKLEYYLVYWLIWGFLDDDANDDTFDYGRVEELRQSKFWEFFLKDARRTQYGNAFDLGDLRRANFDLFASMFWNTRNTAQNFLYSQFQKQYQPFLHSIFGYKFGWELCEDGKSYQLVYLKRNK